MEFEVFEVREFPDLGWDLARETTFDDEQGVDAVGLGVARDAVPVSAAVGVRFP